jgi:peroxidase
LRNLKHLHTLMLNDNRIRRLYASTFSEARNLRYLYLYKNSIEYIESGTFSDLPRLEQLYLHGNELREIPAGCFSNLPKLERLYLQNNRLEKLPADAFNNVGPMTKLRLDSNALVCDCKMLWLVEKMKNKMESRMEMTAVCQEPNEMKGRKLDDMTAADFHCSEFLIISFPHCFFPFISPLPTKLLFSFFSFFFFFHGYHRTISSYFLY